MKKKLYITPNILIHVVKPTNLICASPTFGEGSADAGGTVLSKDATGIMNIDDLSGGGIESAGSVLLPEESFDLFE